MCGRYSLSTDLLRITEQFGAEREGDWEWRPRYNIAPSQFAPIVLNAEGKRIIRLARFGLIPFWAPQEGGDKLAYKMINARSETVESKPAFREPLKKRRCIIPADGFYEWKASSDGKTPYRIRVKGRELFGFAGLHDQWKSHEGKVIDSFAILTIGANSDVLKLHDRMPVILPSSPQAAQKAYDEWLDPDLKDPAVIKKWLKAPPSGKIEFFPVSKRVNSPRNDDPSLIAPEPEPT